MKEFVVFLLLAMFFTLPTITAVFLVSVFFIGYFFCLVWRLARLSLLLGGLNDYW